MLSGNWSLRTLGAALLLVAAQAAPGWSEGAAAQERKELVWSQSDGLRHEIYSSSFKNGTWTDPVKITDDNANNLHPTLDVAPDGSRWAFWSAVDPDGIAIAYAVAKEDVWSEPVRMSLDQSSAIAPSALIDKDGTVLLVWAGNSGGQDEVCWSRLVDSVWQEPKTVNAANDVPDIRPELVRNEQGGIEVRWEAFRDGAYVRLFSTYSAAGWSKEQKVAEKEKEEEEPELPEFVPKGSWYFLKTL